MGSIFGPRVQQMSAVAFLSWADLAKTARHVQDLLTSRTVWMAKVPFVPAVLKFAALIVSMEMHGVGI